MIQIIPSLLATTKEQFAQDLERINQAENLTEGWVQVDFADNTLVQNKTVGIEDIKDSVFVLQKEAHLMVMDPIVWLEELQQTGFKRVLIHAESNDVEEALSKAADLGLETGIVLNPETPVSEIQLYLNMIGCVQVMTIEPGFQGRPFMPQMLKKIEELSRLKEENGVHWDIAVDGGINFETIPQVILVGAQRLVIGSALLKGDIDENLEKIWEILGR